jgi:hypothetical protein
MLAWLRRNLLPRSTYRPDHRPRMVRAKYDSALTLDKPVQKERKSPQKSA